MIPFGGGTSVVGGVTPRPSTAPCSPWTWPGSPACASRQEERPGHGRRRHHRTGPRDGARRAWLDRRSRAAVVGAAHRRRLGGDARSGGQRSLGFGRIEDLFAGGTSRRRRGRSRCRPIRPRAAGPDLRQLVLGSEGRLGILTEVVLRTVPAPEVDLIDAYALPAWDGPRGGAAPSWPRSGPASRWSALSTPRRRPRSSRWPTARPRSARSGLSGRAAAAPRAGPASRWRDRRRATGEGRTQGGRRHRGSARRHRAAGPRRGVAAGRFRSPYLRNALWDAGYAVDTLETATDWTGSARARRGAGLPLRQGSATAASASTSSATCRTSTRPARASTSPISSGSPPTPRRPSGAGRRSRRPHQRRSSRTGRRSATTTALGPTTHRTWPPRRASWAWRRSRPSSGPSTRTA